jgi:hypothetical protein
MEAKRHVHSSTDRQGSRGKRSRCPDLNILARASVSGGEEWTVLLCCDTADIGLRASPQDWSILARESFSGVWEVGSSLVCCRTGGIEWRAAAPERHRVLYR